MLEVLSNANFKKFKDSGGGREKAKVNHAISDDGAGVSL